MEVNASITVIGGIDAGPEDDIYIINYENEPRVNLSPQKLMYYTCIATQCTCIMRLDACTHIYTLIATSLSGLVVHTVTKFD